PRVWTWHALCAAAGVDFPYLLWRSIHGEPVHELRGRSGVRWVRMGTDVVAAFGEMSRGRLSVREYAKSLKPPIQFSTFAADDPAPALTGILMRAYSRFRHLFAADLSLRTRAEHALASPDKH